MLGRYVLSNTQVVPPLYCVYAKAVPEGYRSVFPVKKGEPTVTMDPSRTMPREVPNRAPSVLMGFTSSVPSFPQFCGPVTFCRRARLVWLLSASVYAAAAFATAAAPRSSLRAIKRHNTTSCLASLSNPVGNNVLVKARYKPNTLAHRTTEACTPLTSCTPVLSSTFYRLAYVLRGVPCLCVRRPGTQASHCENLHAATAMKPHMFDAINNKAHIQQHDCWMVPPEAHPMVSNCGTCTALTSSWGCARALFTSGEISSMRLYIVMRGSF